MSRPHEPPALAAYPTPESAPRGRPSWSGLLRLSLVALPVKAYAIVRSAAPSRFHFLHAGCGQRLQYHKHCPSHGPVAADTIVRGGYEHAPDQFVVVEPEELDRLRPAADKALVLDRFVAVASIDPSFYAGRSLALLPDGPAAAHPYAVLVAALQEAGQGGLAQVVWSGQRHLVLVRPCGRVLVLDELHYPARVRAVADWEAGLAASAATAAERELAGQLLALASGPLDWSRYQDTTAADLAALIAAKVAEKPPPADAEPAAVLPLLEALKKSVAAARDRVTPAAPRVAKIEGRRSGGPLAAWQTVPTGIIVGAFGLLPVFVGAAEAIRWAAVKLNAMNGLVYIGRALQAYEKEHGRLPPAAVRDAAGRPLLSWRVLLLPCLEAGELRVIPRWA